MITYLVCYDIEDDRERTRVARILESWGQRVQYSVFEVHLADPVRLQDLCGELRAVLPDPAAEVRFYRLTADGLRNSRKLDGTPVGERDLVVIL